MELELPKWKYKIWNSTENYGIQKPTFQILVQCLSSKIWKLNFQKLNGAKNSEISSATRWQVQHFNIANLRFFIFISSLTRSLGIGMVVDIMVPSHSVIRSHKAADFFVIFGNFDNPATWCWKDES